MGPITLKKCVVNTSISDQYNISNDNTKQKTAEDYFRTNFFYTLMDVVITNLKKTIFTRKSYDGFIHRSFFQSQF